MADDSSPTLPRGHITPRAMALYVLGLLTAGVCLFWTFRTVDLKHAWEAVALLGPWLPLTLVPFLFSLGFDGLGWSRILRVHLLKNIMIPIITVGGLEFGQVVAFAVVTETIFAWPGMGKLLLDSIITLDRPVVVAYLILIVFFLVMLNLAVDILYSVLDPRVRLQGAKA